jgi:hypothetical protein
VAKNAEHLPSKGHVLVCSTAKRRLRTLSDHGSNAGSDSVEGSLLDRGIGFYYTYEEIQESDDLDGPLVTGNLNWGHIIGFSLGAIYVAWPLDFIPDFIPVIGHIDDAAILSFSTSLGGWLWDLMD